RIHGLQADGIGWHQPQCDGEIRALVLARRDIHCVGAEDSLAAASGDADARVRNLAETLVAVGPLSSIRQFLIGQCFAEGIFHLLSGLTTREEALKRVYGALLVFLELEHGK